MFDCFTLVDPTDILTIGHADIYSQGSVNCSASARRGAAGWAERWRSGWTQTVCWAAATWSPRCGHLQQSVACGGVMPNLWVEDR